MFWAATNEKAKGKVMSHECVANRTQNIRLLSLVNAFIQPVDDNKCLLSRIPALGGEGEGVDDELEKLRVYVFAENAGVILDRVRNEFLRPRDGESDLISESGNEALACVPFRAGAEKEKSSSEAAVPLAAF